MSEVKRKERMMFMNNKKCVSVAMAVILALSALSLMPAPTEAPSEHNITVIQTISPLQTISPPYDREIIVAKTITLVAPDGGETLTAGSTFDIEWTASQSGGSVKLYYSTDGGATYPNLIDCVSNPLVKKGNPKYSWTVPNIDSSTVKVKIAWVSGCTGIVILWCSDESDGNFAITPPRSITLVAPNGGETLTAGSTFDIERRVSEFGGYIKLYYSTDGGATYPNLIDCVRNQAVIYMGNPKYSWTVPSIDSSTVKVKIAWVSSCTGIAILYASDKSDGNFTISPLVTTSSPPQNLKATAGDGYVDLSWSAPSDDGGSAITNYLIYRGTTSEGETLLTTVGNVTTYNDTTVDSGQTFFYKIRAKNVAGEGPLSDEASATTPSPSPSPSPSPEASPSPSPEASPSPSPEASPSPSPEASPSPSPIVTTPSAPQNLQATAGDGYVNLSWSAPSDDGGSAVTEYKIYRGTSSGGEGPLAFVSAPTTSYNDTAVTYNQTYYYQVIAVNSAGEGAKPDEASAIPISAATPSPPPPWWKSWLVPILIVIALIAIAISAFLIYKKRRGEGEEKKKRFSIDFGALSAKLCPKCGLELVLIVIALIVIVISAILFAVLGWAGFLVLIVIALSVIALLAFLIYRKRRLVKEEKKRFCMHCGASMPFSAKLCPKCGKEIPAGGGDVRVCKNCGAAIPMVAKFCSECGASQPVE